MATATYDPMKALEPFMTFKPTEAMDFAPAKAFTGLLEKMRDITVDTMNRNVELTVDWMKDAAHDVETLAKQDLGSGDAFKVASEVASSSASSLPSRMFAYTEVAKKAQFDMMETILSASTPSAVAETVEEATEQAKKAAAKTTAAAKKKAD